MNATSPRVALFALCLALFVLGLLFGPTARSQAPQNETHEQRAARFRQMSIDAEMKGLAEPFKGITTQGRVEPGLFPIRSSGVSTGPVRAAADAFLVERGVRGGDRRPLVAIHPGASRPERAWSAERFGELARRVAATGARVLVLGGPRDLEAAARVLTAAGPAAVDGARLGSLGRMAALVARCDLFVGNDSGPAHIAAAVGTRTVSIFGPGVPWKTAPYVPASRRREVTRHFPCAPCRQEFFAECMPAPSGKPWCLESVSVDDAFAAVRELLGDGG